MFQGDGTHDCRDLHGRIIAPGLHFVPGPDACTLCVCDNGAPKWCKAVLCSPPQDCKSFRVGNSCCEFLCLDDTLGKSDSDHDFNADLGLRLIATAITAILSLSLLVFLFHRLRQRKIRGRQNRELTEEERSLGSIGYIAGSLGYLPEPHFEEATAHYPLWKPPGSYYSRGEAPPPYEEAVAAARAEAALSRNPGPSVTSQLVSQHRTIPVNLATSGTILSAVATSPSPSQHDQPSLSGQLQQLPCQPIAQPQPSPTVAPQVIAISQPLIVPPPKLPASTSQSSGLGVGHHAGPPERGNTIEEMDDYRSECENCNISAQQQLNGGLEYQEDLQTMTLHRRTQDGEPQTFYRTSLTLPTQCRKQPRSAGVQTGVTMSCARENWFSSMPASSSSDEEEE
ncbi:DiGeorge syndrome critical region gene 2 [Nesidiocoris tenuis]|nr:DiGeorge syndrome critical region gene 2 [Nesidiocoris tenuis]